VAEITLLSRHQAKPGFVFGYLGAAPACRPCPFRNACLTLEAGHQYRVERVRPVEHPCALQEVPAAVVEVAPQPRSLVVESGAAIEGSSVEVGRYPCARMDCPNWSICAGPALNGKSRFRVVGVSSEKAVCLIGRNLKRVEAL
jgi:uncharacterized protein (UPF0179 family)